MRNEAKEEIEEEAEEFDLAPIPDEIEVDIAEAPENPFRNHYLERQAPGGTIPIARFLGKNTKVAKEIVRRYNAFDDIVGVLQDIHTHTSDNEYAEMLASRALRKYRLNERPDSYEPNQFHEL
jgi:hypothetical protein